MSEPEYLTTDQLVAMGGRFYSLSGPEGEVGWCDTALDSYRFDPRHGWVKDNGAEQDDNEEDE